ECLAILEQIIRSPKVRLLGQSVFTLGIILLSGAIIPTLYFPMVIQRGLTYLFSYQAFYWFQEVLLQQRFYVDYIPLIGISIVGLFVLIAISVWKERILQMINTFITRLIQMKHQWLRLVLWLLLPLFLTWIVMSMIDQLQSESEVPVGIVLEEKTPLALELYEKIEQAPLIRTSLLSESTAQNKLLKHDLDSVFIIHEGYEQNIETDDRQELITGLKSNLSFAYIPTSEVIMSFVQEHAVRAKAAIAVEDLIKDYNSSLSPTMADIIKKSKDVQDNQDFLTTSFTLNGESHA